MTRKSSNAGMPSQSDTLLAKKTPSRISTAANGHQCLAVWRARPTVRDLVNSSATWHLRPLRRQISIRSRPNRRRRHHDVGDDLRQRRARRHARAAGLDQPPLTSDARRPTPSPRTVHDSRAGVLAGFSCRRRRRGIPLSMLIVVSAQARRERSGGGSSSQCPWRTARTLAHEPRDPIGLMPPGPALGRGWSGTRSPRRSA